MKNLPLIFGLVLAGGLLIEHGGKLFAGVFSGGDDASGDTSSAAGKTSAAELSPTGGGALSVAQAEDAIRQGLTLAGVPATAANVQTVLGRAKQESGLNPTIVNKWDSNAKKGTPSKGFLQTIQPTFDQYAVPGHTDINNPVDNTAAAVRYMIAEYGHLVGAGPGGY